jgi:hypothetical protein
VHWTAADPVMSLVGQCIRACSLCHEKKMAPTLNCCIDWFSISNGETGKVIKNINRNKSNKFEEFGSKTLYTPNPKFLS